MSCAPFFLLQLSCGCCARSARARQSLVWIALFVLAVFFSVVTLSQRFYIPVAVCRSGRILAKIKRRAIFAKDLLATQHRGRGAADEGQGEGRGPPRKRKTAAFAPSQGGGPRAALLVPARVPARPVLLADTRPVNTTFEYRSLSLLRQQKG